MCARVSSPSNPGRFARALRPSHSRGLSEREKLNRTSTGSPARVSFKISCTSHIHRQTADRPPVSGGGEAASLLGGLHTVHVLARPPIHRVAVTSNPFGAARCNIGSARVGASAAPFAGLLAWTCSLCKASHNARHTCIRPFVARKPRPRVSECKQEAVWLCVQSSFRLVVHR